MNLIEFLQDISIKGWQLWVDDDGLCFDAPQEESTTSILAQLKQHKAEILQLLRDRPDIVKVSPLSYGQKALWFLWQLEPKSDAYNISFTARIDSVVDITAMIKAFTTLMERHPILRTNYFQLGAEPIQQVNDFQELNFEQVDAAIWSNEQLKEQVVESHQQPFDLKQGSVLRVRWFTRSESEHVLLLTIHHIACDARSRDLLLEELLQLYQTQQAQVAPSLAPVEYSYQDYVYWQKNILENSSGEKLKDYWQNQLAGDLPVLNLATDKPRPPIQTYNGASHKFDISAQLLSKLKVITRREGVTFYMLMLAAFQVLLSRYTEQKDLLVGSPTSGRTQPELASIVGYFVDPVVIRSDLSDNQSFLDFLRQVRQTVLEAITHQDYPFTLLVNKLQPQRDPSRSPIFQAFFNLQKPPLLETFFDLGESQPAKKTQTASEQRTRTLDWGGLKLRPFEIPQLEGQFDLSLEIFEGNSFKGDFRYNADLFNASTIERMATHFQNLLSAIAENPAENITSLDLMSDSERHQLLVEWNDTQTEYPQDQCLHQLFEAQVEQTPGDIAVIFEGQQLTYQELNAQANQLARYLQHQGVQPETLVGICVERSLEMIVGLLAILKTGGAYLPLDPAYPQERLVFILSDSEVSLLLTQSHLADHQGSHSVKTVCLDLDNQKFSQYSTENLFSSATPENLAYVIYTSGSTGKPKGVPIPHRGVVNFLTSMGQTPGLGKEDILLSVTTLSFDIAGLEIYLPLTVGARLVLVSQEAIADSTQLAQRLAFHQVTVMQATPATWKMLLKAGWQNNSNIKILCGGEALDANLAAQLTEGGQEVWNLYGPTETTIWSAALEVNLEAEHQGHVSVGAPIANTQLYILDSALQSVPVGVPGELHIGGTGLGRGYWKRPDLTAAKFIPNPFSELGERLYKTGDLARYQADGKIEFLGRIDHQVKIRGFRIELGEIEVLLKEHLQVEEAVVLAREDLTRDSRLVAYLVTKNQVELSVNELREFLKAKVPDYMLPSTFVMLNQLPLTPNGKIDKKSLPIPESKRPTLAANYQAPQSETEEKIAQIWREVLHLDKVGIHDNFFDLGGHSLLLLELQQKLNQSLQKDFSVVLMFQYPTIAALAEFMRQDNSEEDAFKSLSDRVRKQKEIRQKQLLKKSRHPAR